MMQKTSKRIKPAFKGTRVILSNTKNNPGLSENTLTDSNKHLNALNNKPNLMRHSPLSETSPSQNGERKSLCLLSSHVEE
jgi:hypothetical protein